MISGVAKGGTTSLFHYLAQHEAICGSDVKEVDYFGPLRRPGGVLAPISQYEKHFRHCAGQPCRMEASPLYCYTGRPVISAMRDILDEPRIIISLRDPVRRFWSAFTFLQSMGRLDPELTCDAYLDWCLAEGRKPGRVTPLSVGRYIDWLPEWLDEFGKDLRLIFAEQLFSSPVEVVGDICRWLGLDEPRSFDDATHNPTVTPRSHTLARIAYLAKTYTDRVLSSSPDKRTTLRRIYRRVNTSELDRTMPESVRDRLEEQYRTSTEELAELLGRTGVSNAPSWVVDYP